MAADGDTMAALCGLPLSWKVNSSSDHGEATRTSKLLPCAYDMRLQEVHSEGQASKSSRWWWCEAMKSRQVSFFVEPHLLPGVMSAVDEEVLPRFSQIPHFLGFVALQSELGPRPEIVAMSFWDDGLADSEAASEEFRDEIQRVTGTTSARKAFNILRVMVRDTNGNPCLDSP